MSWNKTKLENVFTLIRNGASIKQEGGKNGIPITRIETIAHGFVDLSRTGYADINNDYYADYYLKEGDILMSHINSWAHLGKCALVNGLNMKVIHGMNLLMLRPNKEVISSRFAKYFFETIAFKSQLYKISNQSVNQSSFSVSKLKELQIPLPTLSIQHKIADILDKANELHQKDNTLLTKYTELQQSIFYQIFGDPVKNILNWDRKLLIECVSIKGGGTPNTSVAEYYNGNIPWVSPKDMKGRFIDNSIDKITELAIVESSTNLIEANSVLVVVRSGILKRRLPVAINTVPVAVNQDMKALTCKKLLNPVFLLFHLEALSSQILQSVRGTTADNISTDVLKNVSLIVPPIELQNEFEKGVLLLKKSIEDINRQLKFSEELFNSVMQKAFRGELMN